MVYFRMHDAVILINPGRARSAMKAQATGFYPHLGIRALESFLMTHAPELTIECLDGEILTTEEIRLNVARSLCATKRPLIGISTSLGSYVEAIDLAEWIKLQRPDVVIAMGGAWATDLPFNILHTTDAVDAVVRGDGEEAMLRLVAGRYSEGGDGVVVRECKTLPPRAVASIERLPRPLVGLKGLDSYWSNFRRAFPRLGFRPVAVYFKKAGCDQRCPYCALPRTPMRARTPKEVWGEVSDLVQRLGANHFWDIADNADPYFWQEFAREANVYNANGDISFFTFVSADRVTNKFVDDFRRAGGQKLFIGFDSHDPGVLRRVKAGRTTLEDNERAMRLIRASELFLDASFILGLPGETKSSFARTAEFVEKHVASYDKLTLLLLPTLTPLPGTHYWARYFLRDRSLRRKYHCDENGKYAAPIWTIEEMQRDYLAHSADVKLSPWEIEEQRFHMSTLRPDVFSTWGDSPSWDGYSEEREIALGLLSNR